ncbi:hypothetical protein B0J11DRAFT_593520 [Dendryphion nanum]|uniref:WSC domain-containing protein n=1 Tax=Dendryphion nanum TaxID=256645 RepID=A0A9P9DAN8_9PLEO|nr:hypothetical protein B0J11DRAFT_593520 [Dendryphion nanum]
MKPTFWRYPNNDSVTGADFLGCRTDRDVATTAFLLDGPTNIKNASTSWEQCQSWCVGFKFFAVEFGRDCRCGNSLNWNPPQSPEIDCKLRANEGDPTEWGGGENKLLLFVNEGSIRPHPHPPHGHEHENDPNPGDGTRPPKTYTKWWQWWYDYNGGPGNNPSGGDGNIPLNEDDRPQGGGAGSSNSTTTTTTTSAAPTATSAAIAV